MPIASPSDLSFNGGEQESIANQFAGQRAGPRDGGGAIRERGVGPDATGHDLVQVVPRSPCEVGQTQGVGKELVDRVRLAGTTPEGHAEGFVRPFADCQDASIAEQLGRDVVLHVAPAAEQLHQLTGGPYRGLGGRDLDGHGDLTGHRAGLRPGARAIR